MNKREQIQELQTKIQNAYAKRTQVWDQYKGYSKPELLSEIGQHYRVHSLTIKNTKDDLLSALVEAICGSTALTRWENKLRILQQN